MIARWFDFFPFNIDFGFGFLFIYVALAVVAFIAVKPLIAIIEPMLDGRVGTKTPALGQLPSANDTLGVAYMKDGVRGVGHVLVAEAVVEGWLTRSASGDYTILPDAKPWSSSGRAFHKALLSHRASSDEEVVAVAKSVARDLRPRIVDSLERRGLVRTPLRRAALALIPLGIAVDLVIVALIRIEVRDAKFTAAPTPSNLITAMLVVVVVGIVMAARTSERGSVSARYVSWLNDATNSICAEVLAQRTRETRAVGLAAAMAGASVLGALGMAQVARAFSPPIVTLPGSSSSGSSSGSSSSCSSSSCSSSSGGSSCGSSCGGGGGCS